MNTFVQTEAVTARALDAILPQSDVRTRSILERRRSADLPYRRGWLIRRALLTADVLGLTLAFLVSMLAFGGQHGGRSRVDDAGAPAVPRRPAGVDRPDEGLRALRARRGANRPHDRRRRRRCLPSRDRGRLAALHRRPHHRSREPSRRAPDHLLGRGRGRDHRLPGRSPAARATGARRTCRTRSSSAPATSAS